MDATMASVRKRGAEREGGCGESDRGGTTEVDDDGVQVIESERGLWGES